MSLEKVAASLSEIERKALGELAKGPALSAEELGKNAGMNIDSARRAAAWLSEKGLAKISESSRVQVALTASGKEALGKGLPEMRLLKALQNLSDSANRRNEVSAALQKLNRKASLDELGKTAGLSAAEVNAALGIARKSAWVAISKGNWVGGNVIGLELTGLEKEILSAGYAPEKLIEKIGAEGGIGKNSLSAQEQEALREIERRGLAEEREQFERRIAITEPGREALGMLPKLKGERAYDIQGAVPEIFIGKKQPYIRFLEQMRKKLLELGFQEMPARLVDMEFYNFDALFQPQNHPARSWSDTYSLKNPKAGRITERDALKKVKAAHENGGSTGSKGWGYKWSEEVASRLMPCAHGTAASARRLVKGVEIPGKYFAIARCFRPDVPDATHLSEFNQMEGFIVDPSFNFRHLLGMLKQFAEEMAGAEKVKFYPDYYPFTEPSVQLSALHPQLGWVEFGGAGIFRPEITEQLGIKGKCLAWGLGIDRLAMFRLGINDIRELFSQNLDWLRKEKLVW